MKKAAAWLAAAVMAILMIAGGCAGADASPDLFGAINGRMFEFSSGVGGWSTELLMGENGTFAGNFHDSEMGEIGEGYPDGTVYGCLFHGQFFDPQPLDEYSWTAWVSLEMEEGQAPESIEDGIRFVTSEPYGLEKAEKVTFFLPGTPVDRLPEEFMFWSHLQEIDPDATEIPYYAIWSEADEAGFISEIVVEDPEQDQEPIDFQTGMTDGWTPAADPAVTEEVRTLFEKATAGLMGVNYVPVAYLGSQLVAGRNHAILCQASVVYPGAQPFFAMMYLYEDLQGNVSILNIADFDIGSLCTYGAR